MDDLIKALRETIQLCDHGTDTQIATGFQRIIDTFKPLIHKVENLGELLGWAMATYDLLHLYYGDAAIAFYLGVLGYFPPMDLTKQDVKRGKLALNKTYWQRKCTDDTLAEEPFIM